MKPLIVFDLDGTLIDSRLDLANSANDLLATYGAPPLPVDAIAGMVGDGAKVLVERVLRAAGLGSDRGQTPDPFSQFLDIYGGQLLKHTRLYDGIADTIAAMRDRAQLAVLTNKPELFARQILDALGVGAQFQWVIGGDQAFARKPDPASLQHLIREAGTSAETTLFVGDSMIDVETARRAAVRVCVVMYGFGTTRGNLELGDADLRADDARELNVVLMRWLDGLRRGAGGL